jgi:hypothetical protein
MMTSTVQIPDRYKLLLLAASFFACISTFFLPNNSINTGLSNIQQISPPVKKYCNALEKKMIEKCKGTTQQEGAAENVKECSLFREDVEDCRSAIISAYRHINLSGCLKHSVAYQTCSIDCKREDSSIGDCKSCEEKANRLKACEKRIVAKELRRYGIEDIVPLI